MNKERGDYTTVIQIGVTASSPLRGISFKFLTSSLILEKESDSVFRNKGIISPDKRRHNTFIKAHFGSGKKFSTWPF